MKIKDKKNFIFNLLLMKNNPKLLIHVFMDYQPYFLEIILIIFLTLVKVKMQFRTGKTSYFGNKNAILTK